MTDKEYEQKKRECWEEFCDKHLFDSHNIVTQDIFGYAFDCAYALGKQAKDADTVIQGWVARDANYQRLTIYEEKPERLSDMWYALNSDIVALSPTLFPDLTWDDDPIEVEIIIKRKKN